MNEILPLRPFDASYPSHFKSSGFSVATGVSGVFEVSGAELLQAVVNDNVRARTKKIQINFFIISLL
ncbi:hypothetical protein [Sedimentibacter sp. B4]|uniref:hypothetical protein n=1 Tax=Sedimentibacter sp. B4 TaxID=304766 RepID=UPI001E370504|nr:hypothetical protein [Sedimentibacter sp. B4]